MNSFQDAQEALNVAIKETTEDLKGRSPGDRATHLKSLAEAFAAANAE